MLVLHYLYHVTTLVVVWIEIHNLSMFHLWITVTTLVVVWIEIAKLYSFNFTNNVTTLVVVWIEICSCALRVYLHLCHHSRSGVD